MKKLLALMMTLALALNCVGVQAEMTLPVNANVTVQVNGDSLSTLLMMTGTEMDENSTAAMSSLLAMLNALSVNVAATEEGMQAELRLKDTAVGTVNLGADEKGNLVMVSDLFPTYAFTMTPETLNQLLSLDGTDQPALANMDDVAAALQQQIAAVTEGMQEKTGQPVPGEYTIEGAAFNVMVPMELTMGDVMQMGVSVAKGMLANESVLAFLGELDMPMDEFSPEALDEALADMSEEEAAAPVSMNLYYQMDAEGNTTDNRYITYETTIDGENVSVAFGYVDGKVYVHALMSEDVYETEDALRQAAQMGAADTGTIDMVAGTDADGNMALTFEMLVEGVYMAVKADGQPTAAGFRGKAEFYLLDAENALLTIHVELTQGVGELTNTVSAEGKTVLALEELMAMDEDALDAALEGLGDDVENFGLFTLLGNAANAMPDEMNALMALMQSEPETTAPDDATTAE